MAARNALYRATGHIQRIISPDEAEIEFMLDGNLEYAYLKKDKFYHNARLISKDEPLVTYINYAMEVKFCANVLKKSDKHRFGWLIFMCWRDDQTPGIDIEMSIGMVYVEARVSQLKKHDGVLLLSDTMGNEHKVYFRGSNYYIYGSRLPACAPLDCKLSIGDKVFCDAIPCISSESEDNCKWIATCVFQGKRPTIPQESLEDIKENQYDQNSLLKLIEKCTSNPRTMFISGRGVIFLILNNEFGIILGQFQYNNYQRILFHRKKSFLFKMSLAESQLSEIFLEGDRVKFIAVGAPPGFLTDWIAVQISVCDSGEYEMPKFNNLRASVNNNTIQA